MKDNLLPEQKKLNLYKVTRDHQYVDYIVAGSFGLAEIGTKMKYDGDITSIDLVTEDILIKNP